MSIISPIGWIADRVDRAAHSMGSTGTNEYWHRAEAMPGVPLIRQISFADIRDALRLGIDDFAANRTDIMFLCVFYPVMGLLLARIASGSNFIPLVFPLASGFALIGPLAAIGLNEMSRRRELGDGSGWLDMFGVLRSPSIWPIVSLGLLLTAIFVIWVGVADLIYQVTLGPSYPVSATAFLHDMFYTNAGWAMIGLGVSAGFGFAVTVLAISVVSFPLLLDRKVRVAVAILTSVRAVAANPGPMSIWGLTIAACLIVGSVPLFLGLVVVLPVLGHSTWHVYRKLIAWETAPEASLPQQVVEPGVVAAADVAANHQHDQVRDALARDLETARYVADRAFRQFDASDPANRLVTGELETRWDEALVRVAEIETKIAAHDVGRPAMRSN